jgi:hypothetical protein
LLAWVIVSGCGEPSQGAMQAMPRSEPVAVDAALASEPTPPPPSVTQPLSHGAETPRVDPPEPAAARWIAIGGGAVPEATQVQIEQDIGLAIEVLAGDGIVLFAAGADAPVVQVQLDAPERDPVGSALADLFAPRGGRNARYRAPAIRVDAPATAERVLAVVGEASAAEGELLTLFVAGHGDIGEHPRDNTLSLWGSSTIAVHQLADVLDRAARPTRLVATTCFSGGFAELAFAGARDGGDAPSQTRCGLFASTWDLEAAGCDPDPDRAAQQGYALHFLEALRGRDREGIALAAGTLDLDCDGVVVLLDAHSRVVIASDGPDVPTTTSERWLRAHAPEHGPRAPADVPEDEAVIAALALRLDLGGHETDARARLTALERTIDDDNAAAEALRAELDGAFRAVAAELLARWPMLDDPWHPEFATVFRRERAAIGAQLERSSSYAGYTAARDRLALAEQALADLAVRAAPLERLVRALDNRELAGRLTAAGGERLAMWRRLRACERAPM